MRCLFCYQELLERETDFHPMCSKIIFGTEIAPILPYSEVDLEPLAQQVIESHTSVTGVQAKLSLHISDQDSELKARRFTIVGLWGGYILKPPTKHYPQLPEVEDLTMHLARLANIKTAQHSLIRLASGNLAFITKRMDRTPKTKLAMEDMCQLTERLTEDKYKGSYEQIAKAIKNHSLTPGLDLVNFFELVLFSFLTGNADMHLKNFSLLEQSKIGMCLSPAYDLVNTKLVNPADNEDMALNLNGKKNRIQKNDFIVAMNQSKLDEKQQENIFNKMRVALPQWLLFLDKSFLSEDFKNQYKQILFERFQRLSI